MGLLFLFTLFRKEGISDNTVLVLVKLYSTLEDRVISSLYICFRIILTLCYSGFPTLSTENMEPPLFGGGYVFTSINAYTK